MNTRTKVLPVDELVDYLKSVRNHGVEVGLCTGVFDVLHIGHKRLLEAAKDDRIDSVLIVGINSDSAVMALKGPGRPINYEMDRAEMLAGFNAVSAVFIINATNVSEAIRMVRPAKWFKGGDYTLNTLDPHEVDTARQVGAQIVLVPITKGHSSTAIIDKL